MEEIVDKEKLAKLVKTGPKKERFGNYKCDTAIFNLLGESEGDKAIAEGYSPIYPTDKAIADIAQKTNWAMDPDKPKHPRLGDPAFERQLKKTIPMSPTYPVENGDLVQVTAVVIKHTDKDGNESYKTLSGNELKVATSLPYEMLQINGILGARPFYFGSEEIRKTIEPLLPTCVGELTKNITELEGKVLKIYIQLKKHIKYSKREKILTMDTAKITKEMEEDEDLKWFYEMKKEMQQMKVLREKNDGQKSRAQRVMEDFRFE